MEKPIKNREKYLKYANGEKFQGMKEEQIFNSIYEENFWNNKESISGTGSTLEQTQVLIRELQEIINSLSISTILDIPCGDFNWMKTLDLTNLSYSGADIVEKIVKENNKKYSSGNIKFLKINLISDPLPQSDLIFIRDCLVHFSYNDIYSSLKNIIQSGSKYLMTTTFTNQIENKDIQTGGWRPINFQEAPFNFDPPSILINENCTEVDGIFKDKCMGLWHIKDLLKK